MKKNVSIISFPLFLFVALCCVPANASDTITFARLLEEMTDRAALARFPEPAYSCLQSSSYDRASKTPEDHAAWFANADTSHFLREESVGDRKEWVMMDEKGPGAIVRWWITAPHYRSTIRVYIDGDPTPAIEANAADLVGGEALVGPPLSAEKARGRNLYLPVPYRKSVKVTADRMWTGNKAEEQGNLYYQINFRRYAEGTKVESFSWDVLKRTRDGVERVQKELVAGFAAPEPDRLKRKQGTLRGGEGMGLENKGPAGAIDRITVRIKAKDMARALRSTILKISFDGKEDDAGRDEIKVYCPVGEFFGSGVGVNPYQSRYARVDRDGMLESAWVMPYQKGFVVTLENKGDQTIEADLSVTTRPWTWDASSMYFHAHWRQEREIPSRPFLDWRFIRLTGRGVFVGDVLTLKNRCPDWWGEGDEKIYVDGERFPSHFGTGTEDYYGYAWCTPRFFEAPFHAQPRAEGPSNYGNVTNLRFRALDAIPFNEDFRFDMEVWHWNEEVTVDYAAATFWYGLPGAGAVGAPDRDAVVAEARQEIRFESPKYLPKIRGFVFKSNPEGTVTRQKMHGFKDGRWKDDDQLWWRNGRRGDRLELLVDLKKPGLHKLIASLTMAPDYGIVQFHLDGKKVGDPIDLFNAKVISTGDITIGHIEAEAGEHTLALEIVGRNQSSRGMMIGIDEFRFE